MHPHLLQSKAWEKFQQLEGYQTFWLESDHFSVLAILNHTPVGNYLFCPYGPTLASVSSDSTRQQYFAEAITALSDLAKEQQAFFVRIEPTFPLPPSNQFHFVSSQEIDPAHTWVIDLTQSQDEILKGMTTSNAQYWRVHQKKGMSIRQTTDPAEITQLTTLLRAVAKRNHFNPQDELHLKHQLEAGFATLYLVEYQQQTLAAALVYDHAGVRYYAHAAKSEAERKLAAGSVLLVQMILDAKAAGAKTFDFWGVTTSEDPKHPWYGFSKYKRSFGGKLITYGGTWDLPLSKSRYKAYQIIRKLNRLKRKLLK